MGAAELGLAGALEQMAELAALDDRGVLPPVVEVVEQANAAREAEAEGAADEACAFGIAWPFTGVTGNIALICPVPEAPK